MPKAEQQNLRSLVPPDRIPLFAPEEDRIYLAFPRFADMLALDRR